MLFNKVMLTAYGLFAAGVLIMGAFNHVFLVKGIEQFPGLFPCFFCGFVCITARVLLKLDRDEE